MATQPQLHINGPLQHNLANPRYFTDASGQAIYLTGSHTWAVMQDMWLEGDVPIITDYNAFITMMADYGHNFMRFWQWQTVKNAPWNDHPTVFSPQPYLRPGPLLANDGLPRFDLTAWNEGYFARLRERAVAAGAKGIYVSIMLFEGWGIKWATPQTDPWTFHPMNPDNNVNNISDNPVVQNGKALDFYSLRCPQLLAHQQAYIHKILGTLNDLDNVLYEVCNEVPFRQEAFDWMEHIARYVHAVEAQMPKQHPVGITAEGGDQDNESLFNTCADWISPSNGPNFEYRYNPPDGAGRKVVVNDTDHLWGHGCEVPWVWKSFTRGLNVLFMDPWQRIPGEMGYYQDGNVSTNQRYYYKYDDMRRNMGYARSFALKVHLNHCIPHNELCTSGYCLANPGQEYVCFFPAGGSDGVNLWGHRGRFKVQWSDPANGKTVEGGVIEGDTRHALAAPFRGMAVLFLQRVNE
jgi:Family of unknown function (DUF6298)